MRSGKFVFFVFVFIYLSNLTLFASKVRDTLDYNIGG
jgi:hypothetical protein